MDIMFPYQLPQAHPHNVLHFLVYITSTQKAVCNNFMKQALYVLKACDVECCQHVFSRYARVIMLHFGYTQYRLSS